MKGSEPGAKTRGELSPQHRPPPGTLRLTAQRGATHSPCGRQVSVTRWTRQSARLYSWAETGQASSKILGLCIYTHKAQGNGIPGSLHTPRKHGQGPCPCAHTPGSTGRVPVPVHTPQEAPAGEGLQVGHIRWGLTTAPASPWLRVLGQIPQPWAPLSPWEMLSRVLLRTRASHPQINHLSGPALPGRPLINGCFYYW